MLSVEAVKIKSSNILKYGQQVRVHILTFNNRLMDHGLLNAELQNNWFSAKNQSNRVEISHFTDFWKICYMDLRRKHIFQTSRNQ